MGHRGILCSPSSPRDRSPDVPWMLMHHHTSATFVGAVPKNSINSNIILETGIGIKYCAPIAANSSVRQDRAISSKNTSKADTIKSCTMMHSFRCLRYKTRFYMPSSLTSTVLFAHRTSSNTLPRLSPQNCTPHGLTPVTWIPIPVTVVQKLSDFQGDFFPDLAMASFSFVSFRFLFFVFLFFFRTKYEHLHGLFLFQVTFFSAYAFLFVFHTFWHVRIVYISTYADRSLWVVCTR